MTLRTVHLHGSLKKSFGASYNFDVETAGEALRALNCAFPGKFIAAIQHGSFKIVRGDKRAGMQLDLDLVNGLNLGRADLHIIPVAKGAANGKAGAGKTVIGAALIGGAILLSGGTLAAPLANLSASILPGMTWGNIAAIGLGVTLMGASTLLSKPEQRDVSADRADSFTLNGPTQTGAQGSAIPLIYGEVITSPVTISMDADIEDIGAYQSVNEVLG